MNALVLGVTLGWLLSILLGRPSGWMAIMLGISAGSGVLVLVRGLSTGFHTDRQDSPTFRNATDGEGATCAKTQEDP